MQEILNRIFVFIFGSITGSFLNVCIYRLPKDKSIIKPRSFCPECQTQIKWYDNIPILSFLFLKGKCRKCSGKISLRYPIVEFITAILFLVLYINFGLTFNFFKYIFFFALLVVVSAIDIDYHAIPAYLCFVGIIVGLGFDLGATVKVIKSGLTDLQFLPIFKSLKNLIFGLGFTYFFKFFGDIFINLYLTLRKKESIEGEKESLGLGDVDFMGMVGVFLGAKAVILVFFLAPFFAIIYSIFALIFKKSHLIPYLPYLSLAALTVFFWQDKILQLAGFNF
ncbi:MAG: prepilin peptidase [Candidatus Omnitrophota bacterium]|nr:prepilin peptidase [Candidatus Omnitrophota bacterium]